MPRPMIVVSVDPNTGMLRRYNGRHCTHKAQLMGGVSADSESAIDFFRKYPDAPTQYPAGAA